MDADLQAADRAGAVRSDGIADRDAGQVKIATVGDVDGEVDRRAIENLGIAGFGNGNTSGWLRSFFRSHSGYSVGATELAHPDPIDDKLVPAAKGHEEGCNACGGHVRGDGFRGEDIDLEPGRAGGHAIDAEGMPGLVDGEGAGGPERARAAGGSLILPERGVGEVVNKASGLHEG